MLLFTNLAFSIGGMQLAFSVNSNLKFSPLGCFPEFLSESLQPADYKVVDDWELSKPSGSLLFDSGETWRLFGDGDRKIIWVGSRDFIPKMVGNFSPDYRNGTIFVTNNPIDPGSYFFPLNYPLGELLMTSILGTGLGIMIHSCGVIDRESGILFAGTSTAGKTTTARLWNHNAGARVINDDHTIIRNITGQFRIFGTPWHGQGGMALPAEAPLKEIFIINHAQSNHAVRIPPVKAAAALLVRCFPALWDAQAMSYTLQFLDELCQAIPCYELGFLPDQSSVEYVRRLS